MVLRFRQWWRCSKRVERPSLAVGSTLRGYPGDHGYLSISARDVECAVRARPVTPDKTGWSRHHFSTKSRACLADSMGWPRHFCRDPGTWKAWSSGVVCVLGRRYRWLRPLASRVLDAFAESPRPRVARLAEFLRDDEGFRKAMQNAIAAASISTVAGSGDGAGARAAGILAGAGDHLARRAGPVSEARARRARLVRRLPDPRRVGRRRGASPLPLPLGAKAVRLAPPDRSTQAAAQAASAPAARRDPVAHPAARGRPWFSARPVGDVVRRASCRTDDRAQDGPPRLLRFDHECPGDCHLSDGRLSRAGCPAADGPVHQHGAAGGVEPGRTARSSTRPARPTGWQARRLYRQPHLPQGAPTSPALANLAAHRLDARLAGLARAAEASYTRYADDLVFSGGESFARSIGRFPIHVAAIALEEGFAVQHRKTRVMRQGVRQRAAGVVINQKINITRDDYDRLKAILYNCVRHGPGEQNRAGVADFRAHLAGRVAHVCRLNPERGEKLMRLFERIEW